MNDRDDGLFEAELRRLEPASLPPELMDRLIAARPVTKSKPEPRQIDWSLLVRWLAPVAVAATVAVLAWPVPGPAIRPTLAAAKPTLKANDVQIDRQLVVAFDAIATMPNGEPVRFRCRNWTENIVLRDSTKGVVIEQQVPRLEVVPVSLETY
jgi:hypothetical protein